MSGSNSLSIEGVNFSLSFPQGLQLLVHCNDIIRRTTFLSIVIIFAAFMTNSIRYFSRRLRGPVGFGLIRIPLGFGRSVPRMLGLPISLWFPAWCVRDVGLPTWIVIGVRLGSPPHVQERSWRRVPLHASMHTYQCSTLSNWIHQARANEQEMICSSLAGLALCGHDCGVYSNQLC